MNHETGLPSSFMHLEKETHKSFLQCEFNLSRYSLVDIRSVFCPLYWLCCVQLLQRELIISIEILHPRKLTFFNRNPVVQEFWYFRKMINLRGLSNGFIEKYTAIARSEFLNFALFPGRETSSWTAKERRKDETWVYQVPGNLKNTAQDRSETGLGGFQRLKTGTFLLFFFFFFFT